ncbi:hypothetical protein JYK14_17110 [Siccirubricoccus sp. KC 17139]|uniref:Uncharacterized protein n=1 Tax=Siccirubricoccus soli TaxID=2899147 RepID=A0ABT1DA47_9PROT|nr:hypothetical protein [Siccirubricoccus soli]MCO6417870.1 hypothetical protein [Siccirubricoccus soli]MCP2684005.1 hypothetical protein [Siccirubricoccus soli]
MTMQAVAGGEPGNLVVLASRRARHLPWPGRPALGENLTAPDFEQAGLPWPLLWWRRARWRRQLRRALLPEPDSVLADFGARRAALAVYVARPCWRR